jgi:hypothetical protein
MVDIKKPEYMMEGHCYVLLQTQEIHPIAFNRFDFVWYPERAKSLGGLYTAQPYVKSIITESAHYITLYDRDKVFVWDIEEDRWIHPDMQTFGASRNNMESNLLGITNTIPAMVCDGGKRFAKYVKKLEASYEMARLKYENPVEYAVLQKCKE